MKELLPEKLLSLSPYEPTAEKYKIQLDANESFVKIPEVILNKIGSMATNFDYNRYPDPLAKEACSAFAEIYNINSDYITAGNGSDELISVILSTFLNKGDKILTLNPDFSMYSFYSGLSELVNIVYNKNEDFSVDIDKVIDIAKYEKVKLIIFSNPCNPTGAGISRNEIIKLLNSTEAIIVVDEAYMDFWDQSVLDLVSVYNNLLVLRTCSKALAMAALRCGFAVSGYKLTTNLRKAKSPYNVNGMTQKIVNMVLSEKDMVKDAVKQVIESRDMLYNSLKQIEQKANGKITVCETNTNFVSIKTEIADDIYNNLLKKDICIRKINNKLLRITAGTIEENSELIYNFNKALGLSEEV